jgi:hypothetical protein
LESDGKGKKIKIVVYPGGLDGAKAGGTVRGLSDVR